MAPRTPSRRARLAAIALVALVALLAACSDDDGGSDDPAPSSTTERAETTTSTSAATTTTEASDGEAAVLEGYRAAWDAAIAAGTANPVLTDSPDVLATMADPALSQFEQSQRGYAERTEHYSSITIDSDPRIVEIVEDRAVLVDCVAERSTLVSNADGSIVRETETAHSLRIVMERHDGTWKRTTMSGEEDPTCGG